jgi:hypothetical protein
MWRKRHDQLEDTNLLAIAPVRTADWEERGGAVIVLRPKPQRHGIRRALDWLFYLMAARKIKLDEVGSFAWRRFDGGNTVAEVARALREEFGDRVLPAEERLGLLVRALRREELLGYPGWDERADCAEPAKCVSE